MLSRALEIIRETIAAHQVIRENVGKVGTHMNDLQALFNLHRAQTEWAYSSTEEFSERLTKLAKTIDMLGDGIKTHFGFEETCLPSILGEVLMQALLLEHGDFWKKLAGAKSTIAGINPKGMSYQELLTSKAQLQNMMTEVSSMIEDHARREEVILKMAQNALQNPAK